MGELERWEVVSEPVMKSIVGRLHRGHACPDAYPASYCSNFFVHRFNVPSVIGQPVVSLEALVQMLLM